MANQHLSRNFCLRDTSARGYVPDRTSLYSRTGESGDETIIIICDSSPQMKILRRFVRKEDIWAGDLMGVNDIEGCDSMTLRYYNNGIRPRNPAPESAKKI